MATVIRRRYRIPGSDSSPGSTEKTSSRAFGYQRVSRTAGTGVSSTRSPQGLVDCDQVRCRCMPFPRAIQLGGRNRSNNSGHQAVGDEAVTPNTFLSRLQGVVDKAVTPNTFLSRLRASFGRLRETAKETRVNVDDLFVGNQMLFLVTASPGRRATSTKTSTECRSGFLGMVSPVSISNTPVRKINNVGDRRTQSFRSGHSSESYAVRHMT